MYDCMRRITASPYPPYRACASDYRERSTQIFVAWMRQREIQDRCSPYFISFHTGYACCKDMGYWAIVVRISVGRKSAAPSAACSRAIEQLVSEFNLYRHTFSPKIMRVARHVRLHAADYGFASSALPGYRMRLTRVLNIHVTDDARRSNLHAAFQAFIESMKQVCCEPYACLHFGHFTASKTCTGIFSIFASSAISSNDQPSRKSSRTSMFSIVMTSNPISSLSTSCESPSEFLRFSINSFRVNKYSDENGVRSQKEQVKSRSRII